MADDATTTIWPVNKEFKKRFKALAAAAIPAAAAVQPYDPIHAVIAAHAATLRLANAMERGELKPLNELEGQEAHDDAVAAICDLEAEMLGDLLHTMPTTLPGVVALLQHLGRTHPSSDVGASLLFQAYDCGWQDTANEWPLRLAEAVAAIACVRSDPMTDNKIKRGDWRSAFLDLEDLINRLSSRSVYVTDVVIRHAEQRGVAPEAVCQAASDLDESVQELKDRWCQLFHQIIGIEGSELGGP